MYKYKVVLGSRRYTTEKRVYINADSAEEACHIAIRANKRMRYAIARRV